MVEIKVIDNFLSSEDLKKLQKTDLKKPDNKKMSVYVKKIENDHASGSGMSDETAKHLHRSYHSIAVNILNELYPEKTKLYEYSEFGITETGSNYEFPIHNDTPNKLLSGVIYLAPKQGEGTHFYNDKNGNGKKTIEWNINRAVFFSRHEHYSWHSFDNKSEEVRRVLIYNLMTNDIKGVCKIENVNYFVSRIKHLINPYLYRMFKFVI